MSREAIESIEEFAEAKTWLKHSGLYDVGLEVLGVSPQKWELFAHRVKNHITEKGADDLQQIVEHEILKVAKEATKTFSIQILKDKSTSTIADRYSEHNSLLSEESIIDLGPRPSPDNVFRIRKRSV